MLKIKIKIFFFKKKSVGSTTGLEPQPHFNPINMGEKATQVSEIRKQIALTDISEQYPNNTPTYCTLIVGSRPPTLFLHSRTLFFSLSGSHFTKTLVSVQNLSADFTMGTSPTLSLSDYFIFNCLSEFLFLTFTRTRKF